MSRFNDLLVIGKKSKANRNVRGFHFFNSCLTEIFFPKKVLYFSMTDYHTLFYVPKLKIVLLKKSTVDELRFFFVVLPIYFSLKT